MTGRARAGALNPDALDEKAGAAKCSVDDARKRDEDVLLRTNGL